METIKKIGAFFALFLTIIGAVSSLVILIQQDLWVAFVGELIVVGAAVPTIVKLVNFIIKN